ncbi:MAG: hypothetical protein E7261_01075 [Lachnospiraceae bacterium]|nr:hypothetical protein [Lachnospiraceae bacterium]
MTFKTNPYYKLLMNTLLLHCLVCFLSASFSEDSALVYICMLYVGVLIFGQYFIRQRVHNFVAYLALHMLLLVPCVLFFAFSTLNTVIMGIPAVILTGLSFKKSIDNKSSVPGETDNTVSPFTALLFPLFGIIGNFYELPIYTKFVFVETILFLVLFICYTFNINEQQYVRDHCSTANIPIKRILATTNRIKSVFITVIIVVMLLVIGINITLPKFSVDYNSSIKPPVSSDITYNPTDAPDFSELHEEVKPPSALAVFLSYVFAAIMLLAFVVLLVILVFSAFKTLRNNMSPGKQTGTYIEEDEITVEALSVGKIRRHRLRERAVTNNDKVRRLFKITTVKKMSPNKDQALGMILNSKTPTEINEVFKSDESYSDEVIKLYQEARYSGHEVSAEDVTAMKRYLAK